MTRTPAKPKTKRKRRERGTGSLYRRPGSDVWTMAYRDGSGKARALSTGTTNKGVAQDILNARLREAALVRGGALSADEADRAAAGKKSLAEHIDDYLASCKAAEIDARNRQQKAAHLRRLAASLPGDSLADLTPDALETFLATLSEEERLSARTVNHYRQDAVAFGNWLVKRRRLAKNTLSVVGKRNEDRDRRRVRRALTDDEVRRLLEVADDRDRWLWYALALYAGLRRGDLQRLTWGDVDLVEGTLTIRYGKAKRVDVLPLHPILTERLSEVRPLLHPGRDAKVFRTCPTSRTQTMDFLRAGIYRREPVRDDAGEPVYIGKGKRRRPKTIILREDADGRVADLHALRSTLATWLARAGTAPQVAQQLLRHSDYRTTLKHYTRLGIADAAGAVANLPTIGGQSACEADEGEIAHA